LCQTDPRLKSKAFAYAIDYGNREMVELLKKLWEPSYDLETLAGLGDLSKVKTYLNKHIDEADLWVGWL